MAPIVINVILTRAQFYGPSVTEHSAKYRPLVCTVLSALLHYAHPPFTLLTVKAVHCSRVSVTVTLYVRGHFIVLGNHQEQWPQSIVVHMNSVSCDVPHHLDATKQTTFALKVNPAISVILWMLSVFLGWTNSRMISSFEWCCHYAFITLTPCPPLWTTQIENKLCCQVHLYI